MSRPTAIVLTAALFGAAVCVSAPALAQVCDKVMGDRWLPEHGPLYGPWFASYVAIALGLTGAALAGWLPWWMPVAFDALAVLRGTLGVADIYDDHDIVRAAMTEGCRSLWADVSTCLFGCMVMLTGFAARYRHKKGRSPEATAHS